MQQPTVPRGIRYALRHATLYRYAQPVDIANHLLHLTPRPVPGQAVHSAQLSITPTPAHRREGTDHHGNGVTWLSIEAPHDRLEVVLDAVVEVGFPAPPRPGKPCATPRRGQKAPAQPNSPCRAHSPPPIPAPAPMRREASRRDVPCWKACWS